MERKLVFLLVGLVLISAGSLQAKTDPKPTLTFYMFEQFIPFPGFEITHILSASPSGNFSFSEFGSFGVSELVLRETISNTSTVIGRSPGWFSPNKGEGSFLLYSLLTFTTGKYSGSSVVVTADYDISSPTSEFAVLGGTGAFRLAQGYGLVVTVDSAPGRATFKWDLYLRLHRDRS